MGCILTVTRAPAQTLFFFLLLLFSVFIPFQDLASSSAFNKHGFQRTCPRKRVISRGWKEPCEHGGPNSNLGSTSLLPLGLSFLRSSPSGPLQPVPSRIPGILSFLAENNTEAFHKALPPPPLAPLSSTARVPGTRAAPRWSHELRLSLV